MVLGRRLCHSDGTQLTAVNVRWSLVDPDPFRRSTDYIVIMRLWTDTAFWRFFYKFSKFQKFTSFKNVDGRPGRTEYNQFKAAVGFVQSVDLSCKAAASNAGHKPVTVGWSLLVSHAQQTIYSVRWRRGQFPVSSVKWLDANPWVL